jgi:hypothetical protein
MSCLTLHVTLSPFHDGISRPQVADGEDGPHIWRAVTNTLNDQAQTADMGWFSSLKIGQGANCSL